MHLILCPLKFESEILQETLGKTWSFEVQSWKYKETSKEVFKVEKQPIFLTFSGVGQAYGVNLKALLACERKIQKILCFGGAGALTEDLQKGDLIINNKYGLPQHFYKVTGNADTPLDSTPCVSQQIFKAIKVGVIETVNSPVETLEEITQIRSSGAMAVAMEGRWGALNCPKNIEFSELRVITDHCEPLTKSEYKKRFQEAIASVQSLDDLLCNF